MSTTSTVLLTSRATSDSAGIGRTQVIILSTVLSVVGFLLIAGTFLICCCRRGRRGRQSGRLRFFSRGISPIDDDEIATWKGARDDEKPPLPPSNDVVSTTYGSSSRTAELAEMKDSPQVTPPAAVSVRKPPPSLIVYSNPNGQGLRRSSEASVRSPRSATHDNHGIIGRISTDHELPQTPIQARAPNARTGLTDEALPGDDPFLPSPKRRPSRISKQPPTPTSAHSGIKHARTRSSRSSMRSFAEYGWAGSELELSPRASHEHINTLKKGHSRVYSSSSVPPRMSFGDDSGVSALPSRKASLRDEEIGRAIG